MDMDETKYLHFERVQRSMFNTNSGWQDSGKSLRPAKKHNINHSLGFVW